MKQFGNQNYIQIFSRCYDKKYINRSCTLNLHLFHPSLEAAMHKAIQKAKPVCHSIKNLQLN